MKKFQQMNLMEDQNGKQITVEQFAKEYFNGEELEVWKNDVYQVIKRTFRSPELSGEVVHLAIRRLDDEPVQDEDDFQEIKVQLIGKENERAELHPEKSRRIDSNNQYHLWVLTTLK